MANETVSIKLSADVEKYISDIKRAGAATTDQTARMGTAFDFVKGAAIGMAGALSVSMFTSFVSRTINSIDALNDLSEATGASIENISALEDIALRTGTSFDTASTMLIKFNGVLKDAKPGSEAEAALKALNLDVRELRKLDPAEALLKTAVAMDKFATDGNMGRLQLELFGKATREGAAYLKDLAEKGALAGTVTKEQADQADRFNKELFKMQKNVQDVARYMASDLVTSINAAAVAMREGGLLEGFRVMFTGNDMHKNNVKLVEQTEELLALEREVVSLRASGSALDAALAKKKEVRLAVLKDEIKTTQTYRALLSGEATPGAAANKPSVGAGHDKTKEKTDPLIKALASYNDLTAQASGLSADFAEKWEALSLVYQRGKISVDRLTSAQAELLRQQPFEKKQLEAATKSAEARQKARIDEYAEIETFQRDVLNAEDKFWRDILAATPTAKLEEQRKTIAKITEGFSAGKFGAPESYEAIEKYGEVINTYLDNAPEKIEKVKTFAEEMGLSFTSAFEDAIVGGKDLGDVLQGLEQDILRIALRKAVTEPMGNFIGAAVTKMFSFDGGGYTGAGARVGGLDGKGGFLSVLHPQETVVDHTRGQSTSSGRGGDTINITIHAPVGDIASKSDVVNGMSTVAAQIQAAVIRSRTHGGTLA